MSTLRRGAAITTGLACQAFARRDVVRAARFVLCRAQLDVPNDLGTNSESSLQPWIVGLSPPGQRTRIIEVGANVGRWSASMLSAAGKAGRLGDLELHALEPSAYTHAMLAAAVHGQTVHLYRLALGERIGFSTRHLVVPAGARTLYQFSEAPAGAGTQPVQTTALDNYANQADLEHDTLIKIDTAGHDLACPSFAQHVSCSRGTASRSFSSNATTGWSCGRWFLGDGLELLEPLGYRL